MKYLLANPKKEMHMTYLQLMQLLQLAITSLTSLFTALIAVDDTAWQQAICGDDEKCLKMLEWIQLSHGINT